MTQAPTAPPKMRPRPGYLTFEAFLALEEPERAEWVDGRLIEMPGITLNHAEETKFLFRLMCSVADHSTAGTVLADPFLMKLGGSLPGRAPDMTFVSRQHFDRLRDNYLDGAADVAVEVISPGSRTIDRRTKFAEYQAGGVREYWLIDPERKVAEFYRLDRDGRYQLVATPDGVFRSEAFPGFRLRVEWLWTRPPLREVEAEIAAGRP